MWHTFTKDKKIQGQKGERGPGPPGTTLKTLPWVYVLPRIQVFLMFLIFKQCFAVVKRILSTASWQELMCLSGLLSTRKSCIILCMSLVWSAFLSFCDESFSHINCLGKRIYVSLVFSVAKWFFTVLMLLAMSLDCDLINSMAV